MATLVREQICTSVQKAGYFTLLVDETKDLSKNEQMSFSVRYLDSDRFEIVERFLTFVVAHNLTAQHLTQYIVDTLSLFNLDMSCIVSQGYDGAAMSGSTAGVQTCIREIVPHAIYIHCSAHVLNLVLVDCVQSISQASEFFFLLQSLYVFMSASKAHSLFIEKQSELHPDKQSKELRLSDTRWACRYASLDAICSTFDAILLSLEIIGGETDKSKAIKAVGLYHHINNFQFIFCLVIFTRLLAITKSLSDQLQRKSLDFVSATALILSTLEALKAIRNDATWDHTFTYIKDVAALHSIEVEENGRRKQPNTRLTMFLILHWGKEISKTHLNL
ncbi:PREDICTED: zinc finger MYM-type protein 1-like [Amphimedon queenslandica]|nr:PREDICTED: zinc finger MYM-type protein 1-like [Amphimedon queenslandica]|eukprot:XP_011406062.1 PREDICTED: zinc finger MYM-type protein 1-like [Amphimedon queenslandica]